MSEEKKETTNNNAGLLILVIPAKHGYKLDIKVYDSLDPVANRTANAIGEIIKGVVMSQGAEEVE